MLFENFLHLLISTVFVFFCSLVDIPLCGEKEPFLCEILRTQIHSICEHQWQAAKLRYSDAVWEPGEKQEKTPLKVRLSLKKA